MLIIGCQFEQIDWYKRNPILRKSAQNFRRCPSEGIHMTANSAVASTSGKVHPAALQETQRGLRAWMPMLLRFIPFALVLGAQAAQKGLCVVKVPFTTGPNFGVRAWVPV